MPPDPMTPKPTGTVTLLFSDIEDSTSRLAELGAEQYHAALEEHRRIRDRPRLSAARGDLRTDYRTDLEASSFQWAMKACSEEGFHAPAPPARSVRGRSRPLHRGFPRDRFLWQLT